MKSEPVMFQNDDVISRIWSEYDDSEHSQMIDVFSRVHRSNYVDGNRALMLAVLKEGLSDAVMPGSDRRTKMSRDMAWEWISSDDEKWPFSFVNCCMVWGLDHSAVRSAILSRELSPEKKRYRKLELFAVEE